ncbi:conserved domain protein [Synechococcus sp. PCC 7335]|uniref:TIGR00341 family protein n=1 Tax=Synechococcus sp. (strain ATCC 29403 / PCC 7335) TaxID=91464 RepID=UPI00017EB496|nr:TIGR00341 family protein [Synechococcus sp. PCC 7335]EDX86610.1 conserved domain protein [Synechococcus sp. PCC 7335]
MLAVVSKRLVGWGHQKLSVLKDRHSGNWHWMESKPVPIASLNRSLWRSAESSSNYYLLLFLSGAIATFGLLSGSSATVIGAMIVAPLMGPIEGIAFALIMANRRLLRRASLALALGALLTVATAMLIAKMTGIETLTSEILARTQPTLLDLGVALAAGAAGALAKSRRGIADALPGVAIAVALVPPLSVVGIGIAFGSGAVFTGALLLFLTNLVGIIFSGGLVFLGLRYGSVQRAKRGMTVAVTALLCLGIPLSLSFRDLAVKKQARISVNSFIRESSTFSDMDIQSLNIQKQGDELAVYLDVATLPGSISSRQVDLVRDALAREIKRPVTLNVSVIPIEQFVSDAPSSESRSSLRYKIAKKPR